jgi:hypothetical protein
MFDFMFTDYRGVNLWPLSSQERREALERGALFAADAFRSIVSIWGQVAKGAACHFVDKVTIPLVEGGRVTITPTSLSIDSEMNHDTMRAAMRHIAEQWGGVATISPNQNLSRAERLLARAYAEVYGIALDDQNEGFRPTALTLAELARIPALCEEIRARHSDAPPSRPDCPKSVQQQRPFRVPRAA